jgi:hypothetical protein
LVVGSSTALVGLGCGGLLVFRVRVLRVMGWGRLIKVGIRGWPCSRLLDGGCKT